MMNGSVKWRQFMSVAPWCAARKEHFFFIRFCMLGLSMLACSCSAQHEKPPTEGSSSETDTVEKVK